MRFARAMFLKFCGNNNRGWSWLRFCNCGAVVVVVVSFRDSSVFGVVDNLVLFSFI